MPGSTTRSGSDRIGRMTRSVMGSPRFLSPSRSTVGRRPLFRRAVRPRRTRRAGVRWVNAAYQDRLQVRYARFVRCSSGHRLPVTTTMSRPDQSTRTARRSTLYTSVIGLAALAVLLQGLWAGLFIREGKDNDASWVEVHARGADVAILLAVAATVIAVVKLRERKDLLVGTVAFLVLLVVEAYLGGEVGDSPG